MTATNATLDSATGLLKLPSTAYSALENLTFRIGSQNYILTPNAQIWPRSLNSGIGGSSDYIYLVVSNVRETVLLPLWVLIADWTICSWEPIVAKALTSLMGTLSCAHSLHALQSRLVDFFI